MGIISKFTPFDAVKDIYQIDYNKLYVQGRKIILYDLDNTIISYEETVPDEKAINLINSLKDIGFEIVLISNNKFKRVIRAGEKLEIEIYASAKKPFKKSYKKIFKKLDIKNKKEVIAIGDQVLTDVFGGNRCGIDVILCNPIKLKSEKWYTKLNRNLENFLIKKIKKKNILIYNKIKQCREEI